jgi:hypothetical protein
MGMDVIRGFRGGGPPSTPNRQRIKAGMIWHSPRLRSRGHGSLARYEPRRAADSILYQVVRDHYETFSVSAESWRAGAGLPRFIDEEFRGFLSCGWRAGGFARFRCDGCGLDRLVPFSCKGRAVCPSCGGRRMAERAAHLVDQVFPGVPVRQWVLTVPHRLRYVLAWDHALCRAVVGVFMAPIPPSPISDWTS